MKYWKKLRPFALKIYYFFARRPHNYDPDETTPFDTSSEFTKLFLEHQGRTCDKWHHYLPIYDQLFSRFRFAPTTLAQKTGGVRFLELGVYKGGSLQLWRNYFGSSAIIHGIDVNPRCAELNTKDLPVHVGSQADSQFLTDVVNHMGGIDVVLDDGSHRARHQRKSFEVLFPLLSEGGLYIIEDSHTSYWLAYGGGFRRPGTAIELGKKLVDDMHSWYHRFPSRYKNFGMNEISSVQFFDSIIVIEKKKRNRPVHSMRGNDPFAR